MYIESVQLKNFRNYETLELNLTGKQIFFTGIMHREKQIFWNLYIFVGQQSLIREVRTER